MDTNRMQASDFVSSSICRAAHIIYALGEHNNIVSFKSQVKNQTHRGQ